MGMASGSLGVGRAPGTALPAGVPVAAGVAARLAGAVAAAAVAAGGAAAVANTVVTWTGARVAVGVALPAAARRPQAESSNPKRHREMSLRMAPPGRRAAGHESSRSC